MKGHHGFTILELLIVTAIMGTVLGLSFFGGRDILQGQQENAALNSLQQSIWQGATTAAARGTPTELVRSGSRLVVRRSDTQTVLRRFDLGNDVTTNLPDGQVLTFTPPGKIDLASLQALPSPLLVKTPKKTYELTISLIGEVHMKVATP